MERVPHSLLGVCPEVQLPDFNNWDAQLCEKCRFTRVPLNGSVLARMLWTLGVFSGISMPERAVGLQGNIEIGEEKIYHRSDSSTFSTKQMLRGDFYSELGESLSNGFLESRDPRNPSFRDGLGSSHSQFCLGGVTHGVTPLCFTQEISCSPSVCKSFSGLFRDSVGYKNHTFYQTERSGFVVTRPGAQGYPSFGRFVCHTTSNGSATDGTGFSHVFRSFGSRPKLVGACTGAGSLSAPLEAFRICLVECAANRTLEFNHDDLKGAVQP